jgi:hypothetical protein
MSHLIVFVDVSVSGGKQCVLGLSWTVQIKMYRLFLYFLYFFSTAILMLSNPPLRIEVLWGVQFCAVYDCTLNIGLHASALGR